MSKLKLLLAQANYMTSLKLNKIKNTCSMSHEHITQSCHESKILI